MTRHEQTQVVPLSKWWTTPSAQMAFERAAERRREKIAAMRARLAEKRAAMKRAVDEWEVVE